MDSQTQINQESNVAIDTTQVNQVPVPPPTKKNKLLPIILVLVIVAVAVAVGVYLMKGQSASQYTAVTPTAAPSVTTSASDDTTYTYKTFSITYPKTWKVYDSTKDNDFFSTYSLTGFDHFVALQNGNNYLVIGIDTIRKPGVDVGGIFAGEEDYQAYLENHDEVMIGSEKFFFWQGDTSLGARAKTGGAGVYGFSSLSKYIPGKIKNEQGQIFNGYEDYIKTSGGASYMVMKLSADGNAVTSAEVQKEFIKALQTIHW